MKTALFSFFIFWSLGASAGKIQNPEDCFEKNKWPCLMSVEAGENLKKGEDAFFLSQDAVVKWVQVSAEKIEFELLQGFIRVESKKSRNITASGVSQVSDYVLVSRAGIDMEIYETATFELRSYRLEDNVFKEKKNEFLSKVDLVKHARRFFADSTEMTQFLKRIETPWKKKFDIVLEEQTKVIQRSVAAAEEAERKQKQESLKAKEEREKVRDLFFYRTFYR